MFQSRGNGAASTDNSWVLGTDLIDKPMIALYTILATGRIKLSLGEHQLVSVLIPNLRTFFSRHVRQV